MQMEPKRKAKSIIIGIAICVVLACVIVFSAGVIGVSSNNIENDARKSKKSTAHGKVPVPPMTKLPL